MENLKALVYGRELTDYQKKLAQREFESLPHSEVTDEEITNKVLEVADDNGIEDTDCLRELVQWALNHPQKSDELVVKYIKRKLKEIKGYSPKAPIEAQKVRDILSHIKQALKEKGDNNGTK